MIETLRIVLIQIRIFLYHFTACIVKGAINSNQIRYHFPLLVISIVSLSRFMAVSGPRHFDKSLVNAHVCTHSAKLFSEKNTTQNALISNTYSLSTVGAVDKM